MKLFFHKNKKSFSITTALIAVVMLFLLLPSCSEEKKNTIASFPDRASVPILKTTNVMTMISDSGITRYRISAPEWVIYDKAVESYWDFPKGARFERFNGEYITDANIQSDKAVFYDKKKLWKLSGNVQAKNLDGELFESNELFWDQEEERMYSNDSITITQKDKIITGKGFESDQTLSKYKISQVKGVFPIKDTE